MATVPNGREKIAENFSRLSMAHKRYRQTDGRTDGRTMTYSERSLKDADAEEAGVAAATVVVAADHDDDDDNNNNDNKRSPRTRTRNGQEKAQRTRNGNIARRRRETNGVRGHEHHVVVEVNWSD